MQAQQMQTRALLDLVAIERGQRQPNAPLPAADRLWRYGLGLHLIKGQPVPRSSHIDPKSDHLSFQVRRGQSQTCRGTGRRLHVLRCAACIVQQLAQLPL